MPLDAYLANGSNYETVRLIALSDRYLGRDDELRGDLRLRDRGDQGASADVLQRRGRRLLAVPDAGADPGGDRRRARRRSRLRRRRRTRATASCSPTRRDGSRSCRALRVRLVRRRTTSTRARSTTRRSSGRTRRRSGATGRSSRRCARGMPSCRPAPAQPWVTEILNRITPRFPRPPLWLAVGVVALVWRRPRGWQTILVCGRPRPPCSESTRRRRASRPSSPSPSTRSSS